MERLKAFNVITTQRDLRQTFWRRCAEFKHLYRAGKRQNDYPADVRIAWVDFVDNMCRDGQISEALAQRATL